MSKYESPDGFTRSPAEERRINTMIASVLGGEAGTEVMNYIKSITTNRVLGPAASDGEIRYMEGGRFISAVLSTRIELGHKENTDGKGTSGRKRTKR